MGNPEEKRGIRIAIDVCKFSGESEALVNYDV